LPAQARLKLKKANTATEVTERTETQGILQGPHAHPLVSSINTSTPWFCEYMSLIPAKPDSSVNSVSSVANCFFWVKTNPQ
jgi:hypothetical protein